MCADAARSNDAFTYCRDDGSHVSWIDHIVCSKLLDDSISAVTIHSAYDFVTSVSHPCTSSPGTSSSRRWL